MNPIKISMITIIVSATIITGCTGSAAKSESEPEMQAININQHVSDSTVFAFKSEMRKLWEDHIQWTRNVILCLADGLPGTDAATTRLLQNQEDIGKAIEPYYGEAAGNELANILKAHIAISADVVKAAKAGNKSDLEAANTRWSENADEISAFLCNANPNWKLKDMQMMMDDHLALTTDEAVDRINKNYDADIKAYGKVHNEILEMADMIADGIVKQFPEKFSISPPAEMAK